MQRALSNRKPHPSSLMQHPNVSCVSVPVGNQTSKKFYSWHTWCSCNQMLQEGVLVEVGIT